MFFPGETITHRFVIPFAAGEIDHVVLSYKQKEAIILEKTITSGFEKETQNSCSISYEFTQLESLLFSDNVPFTIQCNVYTKANTRHTSFEMKSSNGIQYLREVMGNGQ